MRQIGTLPKSTDPRVFRDHLLSLGVTSQVRETSEGWDLWVHNEDLVTKAREELSAYLANPDDARFGEALKSAEALRRAEAERERIYRKNVREVSSQFQSLHLQRRPLTALIVAVCVGVYVTQQLSPEFDQFTHQYFYFFSPTTLSQVRQPTDGLNDIRKGELWRLLTPALMHFDIAHLVLNAMAIWVEGSLIESRRGTKVLAGLTFVSALASNLGQFLYAINFDQRLTPWLGISGVSFAYFGYIWMKGRVEPQQGMALTPFTVRFMLCWLILGVIGAGGMRMANGAHIFGLLIGMLFGLSGI